MSRRSEAPFDRQGPDEKFNVDIVDKALARVVQTASDAGPHRAGAETLDSAWLAWKAKQPFGVLHALPELYQGAAIRRGMTAVGMSATETLPDLDTVAIGLAEPTRPTEPPRRVLDDRFEYVIEPGFQGPPRVTQRHQERQPDGTWTERITVVVGLPEDSSAWIAYRNALARYETEHALWRRWQPLAAWLTAFAAETEPYIVGTAYCALPESVLREKAEVLAQIHTEIFGQTKDPGDYTPDDRRLCCPLHWRRALRKAARKARQFWAAALQLVGGPAAAGRPAFCDDYTYARFIERQNAAKAFGEARLVEWSDGRRMSLYDAMQAGKTAALAQVYAQCRGMEDLAQRAGLVPIFITLTLPAWWHANPAKGRRSWTADRAPHLADKALQRAWARLRSRCRHADTGLFGIRIVEAHRDGTPHLHALLYVKPEHVAVVDRALKAIHPDLWDDLKGDDEETKHRKAQIRAWRVRRGKPLRVATKVEPIRGKATTYAFKYLMKSMNARPEDVARNRRVPDEMKTAAHEACQQARTDDDGDHIADWDRHRAWASERGIRRYDLFGVHGVQKVWRGLYCRDELPEDAPEAVVAAHQAIRGGRWADALAALGAVRTLRSDDEDEPFRLKLAYEEVETRYGETRRRPVGMVWTGTGWTCPLKPVTCTIAMKPEGDEDGAKPLIQKARTVVVSLPRGGAGAPPADTGGPDQADLDAADALEALVETRINLPVWKDWCARMRNRIVFLRTIGAVANENAAAKAA